MLGLGLGIGISIAPSGAPPILAASYSFAAIPLGDASSGFPLSTFVGPAGASAQTDGQATKLLTGIGPNKPRGVAVTTGGVVVVGLHIEGPSSQLVTSPRALGGAGWSTGTGTATGSYTGPDGGSTAKLVATPSGGVGIYESIAWSTTVQQWVSWWEKAGSGAAHQANLQGSANHPVNTTPGAGWARVSQTFTATASGLFIFSDARDLSGSGGVTAAAQNFYADAANIQSTPHSFSDGNVVGDHPSDTPIAAALKRGRVRVQATWVPTASTVELVSIGIGWVRVFGQGTLNGVEVNTGNGGVVAIVGGKRIALPVQIPLWYALDKISIDVSLGGGVATGSYTYNSGASTSLGTTTETHDLWLGDGVAVDVGCDGATTQLWGVFLALTVYDEPPLAGSAPTLFLYASPTGGGAAAGTKVAPASLAHAQTLAQAEVARGGRPWVWLRAGTYSLASTFALTATDNGTTYAAYPGETPTFSGGTAVAGSWTGPDGNGVYSIAWSTATTSLYVNGIPATYARSAAIVTASWSYSAGVLTAPDSTIAGYSDTSRVSFSTHPSGQWTRRFLRVSSVAGATITLNATDVSNANSVSTLAVGHFAWWEGAKELVQLGAGYWHHDGTTLYYKPRAGETLGTTPVVAGVLEQLLTATGALGAPVAVKLRGITFAYSTWLYPLTHGYQCPLGGFPGSQTVYTRALAAVAFSASVGSEVSGCTFTNLGGCFALSWDYGSQNNLSNNGTFSQLAGGAVAVGSALATNDYQPSDIRSALVGNTVEQCSTSATGLRYDDCPVMVATYTATTAFSQNTITNATYNGIMTGWGLGAIPAVPASVMSSNSITGNWIYVSESSVMADGGAIYVNAAQAGTIVSGNYAHGSSSISSIWSIYADSGTSGVTFDRNTADALTFSISYYLYFQNGLSGNTITNNYAIGGVIGPGATTGNTVSGNTVAHPLGASALAIKAAAGRQ